MLNCIMCITNEEIIERGRFDAHNWYTIDRITLKMSDGRRLRRYAVCVNGRWESNQHFTMREARARVKELRRDYGKPAFKPVTVDAMRQYAQEHGARSAHDLLLLGGYGFLEGTCREYDDLLEEFRRGFE